MSASVIKNALIAICALLMLFAPIPTWAGPVAEIVSEATKQDYSPIIKTFVLLSLLSLIPVILIGLTSFTRIIIVLSMLRHAIGLPQTPPNSVMITLAFFLTLFSMGPVIDTVNTTALQPYLNEQLTVSKALDVGSIPVREFMVGQTRESDLMAVLDMARTPYPKSVEEVNFIHLASAFLLSEMKTAFQIGFVIFLPFIMVDLVVAAVLMALGMIMVPPATFSLPLKILLFILIDGWVLISQALLNSYWT